MKVQTLIQKAKEARLNSYSPYSNFKVGAALLTSKGKIYTGTNVENVSLGLSICAERAAIFKAITDSEKNFLALAIVADTFKLISPCGACRQVMAEFNKNLKIIMANLKGEKKIVSLAKLLPLSFENKEMF
ncbi:MAG: cytidine deaminase [Armatimonadetes bacterium]|nr:cytidine deaminase [Armatimonadota bacterium]